MCVSHTHRHHCAPDSANCSPLRAHKHVCASTNVLLPFLMQDQRLQNPLRTYRLHSLLCTCCACVAAPAQLTSCHLKTVLLASALLPASLCISSLPFTLFLSCFSRYKVLTHCCWLLLLLLLGCCCYCCCLALLVQQQRHSAQNYSVELQEPSGP